MSKTLLFLYGTLKSGQRNHHLIAGQVFRGPAETCPFYRLYQLDWCPALKLDDTNGLAVKGELWEVDEVILHKLDLFEGTPDWYRRDEIAIRDCFDTVWAYFHNQEIPSGTVSGDEWPFPC